MHAAIRRFASNLLLAGASLLVVFLLAELGTWIWLTYYASDEELRTFGTVEQNTKRISNDEKTETFWKAKLSYSPHRYIGYIPTPGYKRGADYHNSRGYRGPEFPMPKPPGEFRIVCLGGSTTLTNFVKDPLKAYPAQLEAVLHEHGYDSVRVINAGASGYTSYESLTNFMFRVRYLDPDAIIVYHAVNDALARLVYPFDAYQGDNSGHLGPARKNPPLPLLQRSNFIRVMLIRFGRVESPFTLLMTMGRPARTWRFVPYSVQYSRGDYPSGLFKRVPVSEILAENKPVYFRQNMEDLILLARQQGIQPILMTFKVNPNMDNVVTHEPMLQAIAEHNGIIEDLARTHGVPLFDFAGAFPDDADLYHDPVHMNERGARRKAELIAGFLIDEGLVKTPTGSASTPGEPGGR